MNEKPMTHELEMSENESAIKYSKMTKERIRGAQQTLNKYRTAKQNFDARIVRDEKWWRLRHMEEIEANSKTVPDKHRMKSKSAWLFNAINNKHADMMDSIPTFAVLPIEAGDEQAAKILNAILPSVMKQARFEKAYSDVCLTKCKHGTGVYGAFWSAESGRLGNVKISEVDALNLFWEGGITNIQDSPNLFYVTLRNINDLEKAYPKLHNKISANTNGTVTSYVYDDTIDTTDKAEVIDWYYKVDGILHLCTFVGDEVVYCTEDDEERSLSGLYNHGKYPFVFDILYSAKGTPGGFGLIDVLDVDQENIDVLGKNILNNVNAASRRKVGVSKSAGINVDDFADCDKEVIEFEGSLSSSDIKEFSLPTVPSIAQNILESKITELRETSGNNEVTSGGVPSGVTSGAAIAALQEQGGKTSRDIIKASYRAYAELVEMVIEIIKQYYTADRTFRIMGDNGTAEFMKFSSTMLQGGEIRGLNGVIGYAELCFDIEVSAQKSSPYSQMAQNELALQLYNAGFFAPNNADMALAALQIMDFKDKEKVTGIVSQNMTLMKINQMLSQRVAELERMLGMNLGTPPVQGSAKMPSMQNGSKTLSAAAADGMSGDKIESEAPTVAKSRAMAAEATSPR